MQMLTKFESKSNRVKGIAFHPKRPWILASLHNGTIQLWDYRMGTLLERFDEHDGPVRGIAFHPTQPLFVSGGDDYKIKVWNHKTRKCLFTLNGHLDYVRTVFFHHEYPWILSASDDQTVRIWNWQSRNCIAILTGHNHYVMCAQFHPKEDLVVSASLDQTVRVWDISGLRKKNAAPSSVTFEDTLHKIPGAQADIFGSTDVIVKFVLEGHDRGVNWATFHPTLPFIVSAGDDRQIKLWRMNESKAWEVDTCRGHFNNVSAALFHPRQELIISDAEDKTIRVWDMTKRTLVQTFRREHDRFWVLTAHSELNLFAAGHDNGLIVFKLERERPASAVHQNNLFYVRDKYLRVFDFTNGSDTSVLSLRKVGGQYVQPRSLSHSPAEQAVIVTTATDGGSYDLFHLPRDLSGEPREPSDAKHGAGSSAIFIARNRFAVLDKSRQQIEIRDLSNSTTKTIKPPATVNEIFSAGSNNLLLLSTPSSVILYDIQQRQTVAEINTPTVKYVVWNANHDQVALLSKHTITIANKALEQSCSIHETIRIKSGAWDDAGIFVYSTLNHIKYAVPQGDNGIIRTLDQPVYLTKVKAKSVHCLDRDGKTRVISIDPTEYRFKLALIKRNYDEVLQLIRTSNLVGQAIIAYLQRKGYPEIALHFVRDDKTRFDLAIECGNIDVALETAKTMDREDCWNKLANEALRQGNQQVVEYAYQRMKNFDRLSFLYITTGNIEKLRKMLKIAEHRQDNMARFHNALYLGDVEERVRVLKDVGLQPLAYLTAHSHGLTEEAESILAAAELTPEDLTDLPPSGQLLKPPSPITKQNDSNWPLLRVSRSFFDSAFTTSETNPLAPSLAFPNIDEDSGDIGGDWGADDDLGLGEKPVSTTAAAGEEEGLEGGSGWDIDADLANQLDSELAKEVAQSVAGEFVPPTVGTPMYELWAKNSPLAADHVAAGSFERAMELLNRQVGAVNFEPLKPLFLKTYQATRTYLPTNVSLPSLPYHIRRNPGETETRRILPILAFTFQSVISNQLQEAYKTTTDGKFQGAVKLFKDILHSILFIAVSKQSEVDEVHQLIEKCREYVVGLMMEQSRQKLAAEDPENIKRALELASYFTHCRLETAHLTRSLRSAMAFSFKHKNNIMASNFARRLLELAPHPQVANQARQVQAVADKTPRDEITVEYDQYNPFVICAISYTPIYKGSPSAECPYCHAHYLPEHERKLCTVCEVSQIGANATGLAVYM